jgi:nitrogen fixation protein NifU and related proteins
VHDKDILDPLDAFVQKTQADHLEQMRKHYSEKILQHWLNPCHCGPMPKADGHALVSNPCKETMECWLRIQDQRIEQANFVTDGCGCSIACGSMAATLAQGLSIFDLRAITAQRIAQELNLPENEFHCAEFAADALQKALQDYLQTRDTPWKRLYRR